MKKNPENYDKDNVYIDTIRYIYNQEELISGPEMVRRGEIDQATISSDILDSWLSDDTKESCLFQRSCTLNGMMAGAICS